MDRQSRTQRRHRADGTVKTDHRDDGFAVAPKQQLAGFFLSHWRGEIGAGRAIDKRFVSLLRTLSEREGRSLPEDRRCRCGEAVGLIVENHTAQ